MATEEDGQVWRGWHVIGRFLPMIFLGSIFIIVGVSPLAPHHGGMSFGIIFVWVGGILWIGAVIGMLFTKCPICYRTNWVYCVQERDVVRIHNHGEGDYYARDLAYPDTES
jgi:hypothetical protein